MSELVDNHNNYNFNSIKVRLEQEPYVGVLINLIISIP